MERKSTNINVRAKQCVLEYLKWLSDVLGKSQGAVLEDMITRDYNYLKKATRKQQVDSEEQVKTS